MSQVYNPESVAIEEIERLEVEARDMRRRIDNVRTEQDRRVLDRLIREVDDRILFLQIRLPH